MERVVGCLSRITFLALILVLFGVSVAKAESRPTVVLLHPGGWINGSGPEGYRDLDGEAFRRAGFRVIAPSYPIDAGVPAAERYVLRIARAHPGSYAVGASAGGTLAAYLAARGAVHAAVAVSSPSDFTTFRYPVAITRLKTLAAKRAASPLALWNARSAPIWLAASPQDTVVPFAQVAALARRARVTVKKLHGRHLADRNWVPGALVFLRSQVRRGRLKP